MTLTSPKGPQQHLALVASKVRAAKFSIQVLIFKIRQAASGRERLTQDRGTY